MNATHDGKDTGWSRIEGMVTARKKLATSKKGTKWSRLDLVEADGTVTRCTLFGELAESAEPDLRNGVVLTVFGMRDRYLGKVNVVVKLLALGGQVIGEEQGAAELVSFLFPGTTVERPAPAEAQQSAAAGQRLN
jgi:hypothetical protein